ncbi:ATP-binding protein [Hoeflea alexandrii]|uniref:ATP-binding protein n=1 Tax=Hoeflea alexandrii TaxID=288436 RepID=UPI0022B00A4E|nr:ATP-binding protein [Hoeflea alexandrii]MCZ4290798.1 ATP-binding protein [Hoeflea alexandrii]
MSKISKRVSKYLIARLKRAARLEAFGRAMDAGILESQSLGDTERGGVVWNLVAEKAALFSGDVDQDRKLIQSLLKTSLQNRKQIERRIESGEFDAFNLDEEDGADETVDASNTSTGNAGGHSDTLPQVDGESVLSSNLTSKANGPMTGEGTATNLPFQNMAALRDHVLSIVAGFASALKVPEVSAALLLARAIEQDEHAVDRLLSIMKPKKSIVAVQVPVRDFERHFGYLLEDGLALPFHVSLEPIAEGPTLTGRYKALADATPRKSFSCFGSASLKRYEDDDELRTIVSKRVLTTFKPLIICDERDRPLPARLVAVADMVITGVGIDASLIADVLSICHQIPISRSWFLMKELDFEPGHLGIDDLAIAIRPGRSLTKIMAILTTLEAENRAVAEAKEDEDKEGRLGSLMKRSETKKREKYSGCFDIIEPVKELAAPEPGKGQTAKQSAKPSAGKDHLFVERLAGYGNAQQWALDLKADLDEYRNGGAEWSDLSSRLLLSGPPGTGKTTFAKALCNTLGVTMIATSVARWLEASNLGDVLAAMNATFEHATHNSPCILFIDEVDNIGNRGSSDRPYDDYWSSLVNRVLELLDGASKTEGVIVIGATNRPDKIDPALLRSGRLEKHIVIPQPDTAALVTIIAHHLGSDLDAVLNSREVGRSVGLTSSAGTLNEHSNTTISGKGSDQSSETKQGVLING